MENATNQPTLDVIFDFLAELGEESSAVRDLYSAVKLVQGQTIANGGKGSATLKIDIENHGEKGQTLIMFGAEVSKSLPKRKSSPKMLYCTENGHSRNDPKQYKLPLYEPEEKAIKTNDTE